MLQPLPRGGFSVTCETCPAYLEIRAVDHAAARDTIIAAGWLECARTGRKRERWAWRCPRCNPKLREPSGGMGRSTP